MAPRPGSRGRRAREPEVRDDGVGTALQGDEEIERITGLLPRGAQVRRYLQRPVFDQSKCNQYLYNVVEHPDEDTNLLSTACGNQANACFNDPCPTFRTSRRHLL